MSAFIHRPLSPKTAMFAGLLIVAGGGFYCVLFNLLRGHTANVPASAAWAFANLVTWAASFELCKRMRAWPGHPSSYFPRVALILAVAALASTVQEYIIWPPEHLTFSRSLFDTLRRLPSAGVILLLLFAIRGVRDNEVERQSEALDAPPKLGRLPFSPEAIDWIKAAGNYLELHAGGQMILHRMTMAQAAELLDEYDFVRIHRSTLVNRARIACVRQGKIVDEIKLSDGTWLKVGGAFRPLLSGMRRPM